MTKPTKRLTHAQLAKLLNQKGYKISDSPILGGLRHAQLKQDAFMQPLGKNQDEGGGQGRARIRITRFGARLLDADNCAGSVKWILDACRANNLIRDDDPGSIILEVHQVKTPRQDDRGTMIEITPI
jgi:hypothetical protein